MTILVFSDSHGNPSLMDRAISAQLKAGRLDAVFFLGDGIRDAVLMAKKYPAVRFECVLGNCDAAGDVKDELTDTSYERIVTLGAYKFLLMHGHKFDVKYSLKDAAVHGIELGADCIFFGHTHRAEDTSVDCVSGKIRMINPGSCGIGYKRSFALVESYHGEIICGFGES